MCARSLTRRRRAACVCACVSVQDDEAPASAEEEEYARLVGLLQREAQLSWSAAAAPTAEGLMACLTQDAVWQVLSNYRQGE